MNIVENHPLKDLTTLHIGGNARYYIEVKNIEELKKAIDFSSDNKLEIFILGGGSNVLFSDNGFDGLVIRPLFLGKEIIEETENNISIRVGAGEILDDVVSWTVENSWWGIENMSFVPGLVGAFAIQNVGAYGQEAHSVIENVCLFDTSTNDELRMNNEECNFGYRRSIFNTTQKGRYIITAINLRLNKNDIPNLKYKDVANYFQDKIPTQKEIRNAIIEIRKGKGQDPNEFWTAGSFFSNFQLNEEEFNMLLNKIESNFGIEKSNELKDLVLKIRTPSDDRKIKVTTSWILDKLLGLKGSSFGGAKLSDKHVLNLINTGNATASDCLELFKKTRQTVYEKTGLLLINEPELVGFSKEEIDGYFVLR